MLLMKVGLTGGQGIRSLQSGGDTVACGVRRGNGNPYRIHRALHVMQAAEGQGRGWHCDRGLVRCRKWLYPRRRPDDTGNAKYHIRTLGHHSIPSWTSQRW